MPAGYDTLESVVNTARVRLNDAIAAVGGEVFTDSAAFSIVAINNGWHHLQEFLSKLGFQKFTGQTILSGLAAVTGSNPRTQTRLDWAGFWNGATTQAGLAFPADFIAPVPKGLDERISGSGNFLEMEDFTEQGLPLIAQQNWNKAWEWRGDAIYMPGALMAFDLRMRYWSYAADFVASGTTPFANQTVPIMRCSDALANFIAAEVARPRGDIDGKQFTADGEAAALILVSRENPNAGAVPAPPSGGQ